MDYEFLLAFHSNYGPILYHFRDKARYWSKITIFSSPLCIRRLRWKSPSENCRKVWYGKKLEWCDYPVVKKFEDTITRFWQNTRT